MAAAVLPVTVSTDAKPVAVSYQFGPSTAGGTFHAASFKVAMAPALAIQRSQPMTDNPTHRELDAKLAAVEANAKAREVGLAGKLDLVLERLGNLSTKVDTEIGTLAGKVSTLGSEVRADNANTRWTIAAIFVGTTLAALAALWATQANLLSAFQAALAIKH